LCFVFLDIRADLNPEGSTSGNTEDRKGQKGILADWTQARQTPFFVSFAAFCVLFSSIIRAT
jgi:hypothetical protein